MGISPHCSARAFFYSPDPNMQSLRVKPTRSGEETKAFMRRIKGNLGVVHIVVCRGSRNVAPVVPSMEDPRAPMRG